jgi:hypothetical protein
MTTKNYRVQATSTINTYVYCFYTAYFARERAEKEAEGRLYSCMTAGLFAAFTFEGYLNHIGGKKIKNWDAIEKKLGPKEKLLLLEEILSFKADQTRPPFQTLHDILALRNHLAHGKTQTVNTDVIIEGTDQAEKAEYPQAGWELLCNLSSISRMVQDVEKMIRSIHSQLGYKRDPLVSPKSGFSQITEVISW